MNARGKFLIFGWYGSANGGAKDFQFAGNDLVSCQRRVEEMDDDHHTFECHIVMYLAPEGLPAVMTPILEYRGGYWHKLVEISDD